MEHFIVTYYVPDEGKKPQYFKCQADDTSHAEDQCRDANPDGFVSAIETVCEFELEVKKAKAWEAVNTGINSRKLCPVCGELVYVYDVTKDGRLIASCGDAITLAKWEE